MIVRFSICLVFGVTFLMAQIPSTPAGDFHSAETARYQNELREHPRVYPNIDLQKKYALYELIDIAERQNPATRVAWEQVKEQFAAKEVARSALYPTLALDAPTTTERVFEVFPLALAPVLGGATLREDLTTINPLLALNYRILDFGQRRAAIDSANANLQAAGSALAETHEQVALAVTMNFYKVISDQGLVAAAEASLKDAQSTENQVHEQMEQGLATLPNYLSAQAQRAQAEYNLENASGNEQTADSDLARSAGLNPAAPVLVKDIADMPQRSELESSIEKLIGQALVQRPDLLESVAEIHAADAEIKSARSELFPKLDVTAQGGYDYIHTLTSAGPAPQIHQGNYRGEFSFTWEIFDARRRHYQIIEAEERKRAAQARLDSARDQAANQVWSSYVAAKVAFRRLDTSKSLLTFAQTSYDAARFSFDHGLATYIDVLNAEQALAQARNEQVQAEAQVLSDLAQLAYQTGDLLNSRFLKENRNEK